MDDDAIRAATDRWEEADLIDEETAAAIRDYEDARVPERDGRLTTIVAIMGALLVGVGIIAAVAAAWEAIGPIARTGLLVAAPVVAGTGGILADRRGLPRVGAGLWILSALIWGPVLAMLADIHTPQLEFGWVLLAWGGIATPMGHAFRTRLATGVGIGALLLSVTLLGPEQAGIVVASLLGAAVLASTIRYRSQIGPLLGIYRVMGITPGVLGLLWLAIFAGDLRPFEIPFGPYLLTGFAIGIAGIAVSWYWSTERVETAMVAIPVLAALLIVGIARGGAGLPELGVLALTHGALLVVLLAIAGVGVGLGSKWLVNGVALGFFLQVLSLLITLGDQLPGAIALIVAGIVLLVVAGGLERGRRRLLERFVRE